MVLSSNDDVYAEIRGIIKALQEVGDKEISGELSDAMCGYTSGEILGDVGLCLRRLLSNQTLLVSIKKEVQVESVLIYIESVW